MPSLFSKVLKACLKDLCGQDRLFRGSGVGIGTTMMVRGLLLLALVMVLAGAYAIVNGAGMILNERGWSQVIAGSVVMTGGFIVAALTALLHEMQKNVVRTPVHDRSEPHVVTSPVMETAGAASIVSASVLSASVLSDAAGQVQSKPHAQDPYPQDPHSQDPHSRNMAAAYHAPESLAVQAEVDAHPHAHETIISPPAADYDHISPVASAHVAQETVNFAPEPVAPAADTGVVRPQLRQPTLFELVQGQAPVNPPPAPTPSHERTMPQQIAPAVSVPAAERVLLASYSTGGVGYFMYSDQSIEAEMAIGRYRFNSMDELRRFIETQEGGVKVSD
jgi:hypothetical protein